jgi:alanine-alpha-ketoisovalerate/valine-pyruvate aminotransferase
MDQSMNIGSEVHLAEGLTKHVRIGTIKLIREVRQATKDIPYKFAFCIGRDKMVVEGNEVDIPAMERKYQDVFSSILVEGLTDEEYEQVDEDGIKELDKLLERFL